MKLPMQNKSDSLPFTIVIRLALKKIADTFYNSISSTNLLSFFSKAITLLRSHFWLFLIGIINECIYIFYILYNFPLARYFKIAMLTAPTRIDYLIYNNMGYITGYSLISFFTFMIVTNLLFALFGLAWWQAKSFQDHTTLWIILGFGSIFTLTTTFVYPLTAGDLFLYVVRSLVMLQHHANPMITPPSQFAQTDPLMKLAQGFQDLPSPYGPLGILLQALPVAIAGKNLLNSLLLTKFLFSSISIICAFLSYKIINYIDPRFAIAGALMIAWNPFVLSEYSINSHNDIAMMLFILLAIFALIKERPVWALTLLTASALIKFASLVLIPLFFLYSFVHQPTWRKRIRYTIIACINSLILIICSFAPFWIGPQTLQRFFQQVQEYRYSFGLLVYNLSSGKISLDHAKLIGWILFGACLLYTLWLSSRDFSSLLKGCFLTMLTLLAFGASFIQPWYLIWPFMLAILIPQTEVWLAVIFLAGSGVMAGALHQYLVLSNFVDSIVYLAFFLPPALLLIASHFLISDIPFRKLALLVKKGPIAAARNREL